MTDYIRNKMSAEQYYMEHMHEMFDEEVYPTAGKQRFFYEDNIAVRHKKFKAWLLKKHGMKVLTDDEIQFVTQEAFDTFMYETEKLNTMRMLQNG